MPIQRPTRVKRTVPVTSKTTLATPLRRSARRAAQSKHFDGNSSPTFSALSLPRHPAKPSTHTNEDASQSDQPFYRSPKNPRLSALLYLPNFPNTAEEASIVLSIARAGKDESVTRQLGLRLALRQTIKHVNGLAMRGCDKEQQEAEVGSLQRDLSIAAEHISEAELDLGMVRSLVRRKGFPLEFDVRPRMPAPNSLRVTDNTIPKSESSMSPSPVPSDFGRET